MSFIWLKATWPDWLTGGSLKMRKPNIARNPHRSLCCRCKLSRDLLSVSPRPKSAGVISQGNPDMFICCDCFKMKPFEMVLTGWNVACVFGRQPQPSYIHIGNREATGLLRGTQRLYLSKWMKISITDDVLPYASSDIKTACVALGLWLRPVCFCLNCGDLA